MAEPAHLDGRRPRTDRSRGLAGPVGVALVCGFALLAGCSGDSDAAGEPTGSAGTVPMTSVAPPPTDVSSDEPSEPSETGLDIPATTVAPSVESIADRSEAPPADVVRVVSVTVVAPDADGDERIVIDSAGGTPGYRLRYVDAVRINDEPVLVDGNAFLELVLQSADPEGDQGLAAEVAVDLVPDQPIVTQVQFAYYLGDELTYAIGLSRVAPFTVTTTGAQITITLSS